MQYRRVGDLLGRDRVVRVSADTSVREACQLMRLTGVGCLLVCDGDRPLGVFGARDAGVQVVALGHDPDRTTLAQVVVGMPPTVAPEASLEEALTLVLDGKLEQMPVTEGARVVGLLTLHRLLEANRMPSGGVVAPTATPGERPQKRRCRGVSS